MPTLARLSFWVSPDRIDTFEAAYEKKILPILKEHGLERSSEQGRATVEGVFSRLFEFTTPAELMQKRDRLSKDPRFREVLGSLGVFVPVGQEGPVRHHFGIYSAPAGSGRSVKAGAGIHQGVWHSFDVSDGLPSPAVCAIVQDREENLWFAAPYEGGVTRYDGETFLTFTTEDGLGDDRVHSVLEDREGNLWFGTEEGGATRYDGETFLTFTTEDGLGSNWVPAMFESQDGNLWFGTKGGGVSQYDGDQFVTFTTEDGLASDFVYCILEDRRGNLWFGTGHRQHIEGSGVTRYDGNRFTSLTTEEGLAHNTVMCIFQDREGNLWFGTGGGGVTRYDGNRLTSLTTEEGLADDWVISILEDREGNLWFGTTAGVSRYDGERFATFTAADGLAHHRVISILEDRDGNLWFGTPAGVSRYNGHQLVSFTEEDGLTNNGVMSALEDRTGNLWFGTWTGVTRHDGEQWIRENGFIDENVCAIIEDQDGNLWFGAAFGKPVTRYDGRAFVTFTTEDGLADSKVFSMLEDRDGNLWFGTKGGVTRYDGETFATFTTEDGLADNSVWSIVQDRKGNLWFGTRGGVSRYDGHKFTSFRAEEVLGKAFVFTIIEDQSGNLWFGARGGVSRYDGSTFVSFTTEEGLPNNEVISILEDRGGHLWFGTFGGGVGRYDGLVFQHLQKRDGLLNNAIQEILQDRDGDIWIATEGGVTRYRGCHTPPGIRITDVVADRRYGPVEEIRVPVSQKYIAFEFQGRSLTTRPEDMAYVYRLKGYDSGRKPAYTGRVEYHDVPLGEYVFEVKAVDRDLNYSEPVAVQVTVEPDPHLEALAEVLREGGPSGEFVGKSATLRRVQVQLREVAPTDMTVLILGETGTGKGLAAHTMHEISGRADGPFIQVHCGAIPETLVESELFGHEKGAFTGAISRKLGKVELAEEGTLFLDEIGDMPLESQAKLLRFLEERRFERVGGTETLEADVRIVAATNRDLMDMVETGVFREDLYYRLQVFVVELPPLRDRLEDIPLLAVYFAQQMAEHLSKSVTHVIPEALSLLQNYAWPGNVRELEHAIQRAVIVCPGPAIRAEDVALTVGQNERKSAEEPVPPEEYERRYICTMLEKADWVIKGPRGAATLLGMPPSTLHRRIKKLGIVRP